MAIIAVINHKYMPVLYSNKSSACDIYPCYLVNKTTSLVDCIFSRSKTMTGRDLHPL